MKTTKRLISITLSLVLLISSVYVGGIVSFAQGASLTKIVNTFDDEGVEYNSYAAESNEMASERFVNGVQDSYFFAVWNTYIDKDSSYNSTEQNVVKFVKAEGYTYSWPAAVKIYDNSSANFAEFKPKANTSYSIKLRYNVVKTPSRTLVLQLRQRNTQNIFYTYNYNEEDILIPDLVTISSATNGWKEVSTTFTTGSVTANLLLNLSSLTSRASDVEVLVDDIIIEELYNVTVNNYTPNENKTVGLSQNSLVSSITVPEVSGYKFAGVYADEEYSAQLSADVLLDNYANKTIYFKWEKITTSQYYCGFEDYKVRNKLSFDSNIASIVDSPVYLGSKAMKLNLAQNGISAFEIRNSDAVYITANTEYEISFAYKSDKDISVSVGTAKATDVCGTAVAQSTTELSATDAWETATLNFTTTNGTDDAFALAMLTVAKNGATVYFDDILVTDLTEVSTTTMPNISLNTYPTLDVFSTNIWDGSVSKSLEGLGTEASPYLIKTGADLACAILGGGNGAYFKLTNNIYLNDLDLVNWKTGEPVGEYVINSWYDDNVNSNKGFEGTLDGDGYTVYGMYFNNGAPDENANWGLDGAGLIPRVNVGQTANIVRLGVDYAYVSVKDGYGASAFVGTAGVTLNTTSDTVATVNIDQCYAGANVTLIANTVGAFRGSDKYSALNISNCYTFAEIICIGANRQYGFYGGRWESAFSITNSFNGYSGNDTDGIISEGYASWIESECSNNYATGYNYIHQYAGEVVYYATHRSPELMKGMDVFTNSSKMPNLNTNGVFTATDSYPILTAFIGKADTAAAEEEIVIWDGTVSESLEGEGTEDSPYLIKNGNDLAYAISSGGGNDKHYKLTADIYLNKVRDVNWYTGHRYNQSLNKWFDNTAFAGTIDGDGHTVYGLYYRDDDVYGYASWSYYASALIPRVNRGDTVSIKNLGIDYAYIAYRHSASAFVGFAGSTGVSDTGEPYANVNIDRCYVGSTVKIVGHDIGAFRGGSRCSNTTITNSYSLATLEATEKNNGTGYTYGLLGNMWDSSANISNCYNANGPIASESSAFTRTNCYETERSKYGDAKVIAKENMLGGDVFTNSYKMPNLADGAFVPAYNTKLNDYFIYLPAGTVFEENYDVKCYDSFFVPLNIIYVINKAGMVTRGAYFSFNEFPDTSKIIIPTEVYDFVRYGSRLELAANDTYYGDRMEVIKGTLDEQPEKAVNYMYITDMHYPYGPYYLLEALQNQIKLIVKTANEDDSIDFVCIGGDSINGNQSKSENLKLLNAIFTPLLDCNKPVFIIQGNHDDSGWQSTFDMTQMFSHKDWRDNIINKYVNRTLDDEDGTVIQVVNNSADDNSEYYYYDLENKKTRLIILDSIDYDMEYDENGTVTGLEILDASKPESSIERYKTGYTYWGYSKEQLKWLADEALGNLPEGYDVVFLSHMGIDDTTSGADFLGEELRGIIGAYQNKTEYVNADFDIDVDYTGEQGRIRSFQFGHTHYERKYYDSDIDLVQINTGLSNAYTITNGTRIFQSEAEAQFDVMSVTNDSVYKMTVGAAGTTLKIYYPIKTKQGDINSDTNVDICDLVYLRLMEENKVPLSTTADISRQGALAVDIFAILRNILNG